MLQSINKDKEVTEVKIKEEDSWAIVAKKMKNNNVLERVEKVESDMIVKKSVTRKVKSTNDEEEKHYEFHSQEQDRMCLERWVRVRAVMI